jgi:prephenate dehydrogenase
MAVVTIIGGSGRMGAWFANFLAKNGYTIIICDKNEAAARTFAKKNGFKFIGSETRAVKLSEIILLATPTHATGPLLKRIAPRTPQTKLLIEISSTKEPVRKTIETLTRHGIQIMSIHPMFGPGARSLADKSIIVAQEPRNNRHATRLLSILRKRGARIVRSDLDAHDKIVATTLALPHLMNFAFIETLRQLGLPLDKVREMGGTTLKLQLIIAEALYHESLRNEASILADNKQIQGILAAFLQQIAQVRGKMQDKKQGELLSRLRNDVIYVRKDKIFLTAYHRFAAAVEASSYR